MNSLPFCFLFTVFSSILVHVYCIQFHNKLIPFYCIQLNFDSYLWVLHSVPFWFLFTAFSSILISMYCIQFHSDFYLLHSVPFWFLYLLHSVPFWFLFTTFSSILVHVYQESTYILSTQETGPSKCQLILCICIYETSIVHLDGL